MRRQSELHELHRGSRDPLLPVHAASDGGDSLEEADPECDPAERADPGAELGGGPSVQQQLDRSVEQPQLETRATRCGHNATTHAALPLQPRVGLAPPSSESADTAPLESPVIVVARSQGQRVQSGRIHGHFGRARGRTAVGEVAFFIEDAVFKRVQVREEVDSGPLQTQCAPV